MLCLDGWRRGFVCCFYPVQLFFMCIWCSDLSKRLTLNVFYQCHQLAFFNNMHSLCRHGVKMGFELRNKISAVFYSIFYATRQYAVGFIFEMSCMSCAWMQSELVSHFESCFEFASSFVCFVVFLLDACSDLFFSDMFNVYLPTNKPHFYDKNKVIS